ncbi:MAG: Na+/H+ antiporter NhaA [Actinomycetota bacterium]|nr:Na+/H+ antiporter NhaA [Actinomycetota bacterium]
MASNSSADRGRVGRVADRAGDLGDFLRAETTGGKLLLSATALALLWANLSEQSYRAVWDAQAALGPAWLHLDLPLADWAADGLLAIFFFVAGMEVKRELTVGELADRRSASLPLLAALGGMVVPALVALAASGGAAAEGGAWAIPVATDIAFALGVLALVGSTLPSGVRVLLLSMAVIDDLAAIALIAVLFTSGLSFTWLAAGALAVALYWLTHRLRVDRVWLLWGLAVVAWVCVHASGVHATVSGIALGLLTPVRPRAGEAHAPSARYEHRLHPISAGFIVPVFALAAAGIPLAAAGDVLSDPVAIGVVAGLVLGKPIGVFGGAWLAVKAGLGTLPDRVGWRDVLPVALLAGVGYTVSLLIVRLALAEQSAQETAAAAVLIGSALASVAALAPLRRRARRRA